MNSSDEITMAKAPGIIFAENFVGAGHAAIPSSGSPAAGYPWVKKLVGSGSSVSFVPRMSRGVFQLALGSTSEKEDAVLYWNDACTLDATKNLIFECKAALAVSPSLSGVQAVFGIADAWADGPDNNPHYLQFGCGGNANLLCRSKDGIAQSALAATAQQSGKPGPLWSPNGQLPISLDTNFHNFRIDVSIGSDVGFYLDGNRVNSSGSISFEAIGDAAILQPYFAVYKPSGAGIATLQVDALRIWQSR